jgi:hypothetical protein
MRCFFFTGGPDKPSSAWQWQPVAGRLADTPAFDVSAATAEEYIAAAQTAIKIVDEE